MVHPSKEFFPLFDLSRDNTVSNNDETRPVFEKRRDARITLKSLMSFPYSVLESVFYGIHNLNIPVEMSDVLSDWEILAKYFSAGGLKRHNSHKNRDDIPQDFMPLVRFMDENAKRETGGNFRRHLLPEKGQYERLAQLSGSAKGFFVRSFHSSYNPSMNESILGRFYDPNCDGMSRTIYAKSIRDFLKGRRRVI